MSSHQSVRNNIGLPMRNCFLLFGLFLVLSCARIDEQDFFRFNLVDSESPSEIESVEIDTVINTGAKLVDCAIAYPYLFSNESGDNLFSVTDISTGSYLGQWCRCGRGPEEPLYVLPISELYHKGNDLFADLFSYHGGKLLVWNVSESLRSDTDVYEGVVNLEYSEQVVPFRSLHRICDSLVLVCDTRLSPSVDEMIAAPSYDLYNTHSGKFVSGYNLFNMIVKKTSNPRFTSKSFLSISDCMKPDRTKIAFAMRYMPVINILDLKSGEVKGIRLKGAKGFTTRKQVCHFVDISADDDYIYALYYGKERVDGSFPEILHVFDWGGNWVSTKKLSHHASALQVSSGRLYLYNFGSDALMSICLDKL